MQTPLRNANNASGRRQALRTPRFIFGSSQPVSGGAGAAPAFAATPRFLLGTQTRGDGDDDIETSDTELPSTMELSASTRPRRGCRPDTLGEDEIILDSEGDDDDMEIRDMQDEYDLLFPESPSQPELKSKRRRLSGSPSRARQARRSGPQTESNIPSSPGHPVPSPSTAVPGNLSEPVDDTIASPPPTRRPLPPSTPMAATSNQFHATSTRQPRFILNASQHQQYPQPPSTNRADIAPSAPLQQPHPSQATTIAPQSTPRRRPNFVLPITPSRHDPTDSTQQLPPHHSQPQPRADPLFSPLATRTTGRPGRPSNRRQEYVRGGMAAHVRNWIFELQANRQATRSRTQAQTQTQQLQHTQSRPERGAEAGAGAGAGAAATQSEHPSRISGGASSEKYYLTTEIKDVVTSLSSLSHGRTHNQHGGAGHPAPTTLITPPTSTSAFETGYTKILLFGSPVSAPVDVFSTQRRGSNGKHLQRGDWVGIRRGVVWEMEISSLSRHRNEDEYENDDGRKGQMEKWLVGVDWDILPRSNPPAG